MTSQEACMDNEYITSVVNNFIGGICIFEVDSVSKQINPVFLNDGLYRMLGGNKAIVDRMFLDIRRSIIPEDIPMFDQGISDMLADNGFQLTAFECF